jgi:hypothetical protein
VAVVPEQGVAVVPVAQVSNKLEIGDGKSISSAFIVVPISEEAEVGFFFVDIPDQSSTSARIAYKHSQRRHTQTGGHPSPPHKTRSSTTAPLTPPLYPIHIYREGPSFYRSPLILSTSITRGLKLKSPRLGAPMWADKGRRRQDPVVTDNK